MLAAFDHIATKYDNEFTYSLVGMAQRKLVWQHLEKILSAKPNAKVLELNCGTGEDALWLASKGATVLATDISSEMLRIAEAKAIANNVEHSISFKQIDLNYLDSNSITEKFDCIFSNFGGLNCMEPKILQTLLQYQLPALLTQNGSMVLVVMPTFCLWESLWFAITFKWKKVFRRFSKEPLNASLSAEESVRTWYYAPSFIKKHLANNVRPASLKPIGFFVPPSYLNHTFSKRKKTFSFLEGMEKKITNTSALAYAADHYFIHLQKLEK